MKTPRQLILEEISEIARVNGVLMSDMVGWSKVRAVVRARRAAMWFIWFKYGKTFSEVARVFGRTEHTATMHAIGVHLLNCGFTSNPMAISAKRRLAHVLLYQRSHDRPDWKRSKKARDDANRRRREANAVQKRVAA